MRAQYREIIFDFRSEPTHEMQVKLRLFMFLWQYYFRFVNFPFSACVQP